MDAQQQDYLLYDQPDESGPAPILIRPPAQTCDNGSTPTRLANMRRGRAVRTTDIGRNQMDFKVKGETSVDFVHFDINELVPECEVFFEMDFPDDASEVERATSVHHFDRQTFNRVSMNSASFADRASFDRASFKRISKNTFNNHEGSERVASLNCFSVLGPESIFELEDWGRDGGEHLAMDPMIEVLPSVPVVAGAISLYRSLKNSGALPDVSLVQKQIIDHCGEVSVNASMVLPSTADQRKFRSESLAVTVLPPPPAPRKFRSGPTKTDVSTEVGTLVGTSGPASSASASSCAEFTRSMDPDLTADRQEFVHTNPCTSKDKASPAPAPMSAEPAHGQDDTEQRVPTHPSGESSRRPNGRYRRPALPTA